MKGNLMSIWRTCSLYHGRLY